MARDFLSGSAETVSSSTGPFPAAPYSMGCWFNCAFNLNATIMGMADNSVSNHYARIRLSSGTGNYIQFEISDGGGTSLSTIEPGQTWSQQQWHHALAIAFASDDQLIYLDGVNEEAHATADVSPSGLDRYSVGGYLSSSPNYITGKLAEAAVWDVALSAGSRAMLAAGYSPLFVQPESLVRYSQIIGRTDPEIDLVGGNHLTVNATPLAFPHPPIIMPSAQILRASPLTAAAAPKYIRQHLGFHYG